MMLSRFAKPVSQEAIPYLQKLKWHCMRYWINSKVTIA